MNAGQNLPDYNILRETIVYLHHPMNVQIARAEGVYIFDDQTIVISMRPEDHSLSTFRTTTHA